MATSDPEKAPAPIISRADTSGSEYASSPVLEPIRTNLSRRSIATQRQEDDEELYEAAERAASFNVATEADLRERNPVTQTRTGASAGSTASRPPDFEVAFGDQDPENPKNWAGWYRGWVMGVVAYNSWLVVLYSTSYTACTPGLVEEFDSSRTIVTLGLTTYLLGLACGSLAVAPLSELYGRQIVYTVSLIIWTILIIPCALATNLTTLLVVRFVGYVDSLDSLKTSCCLHYFSALFGAAFVSNGPGSVVDISRPEYLALYMSIWSIAPLNSPTTGTFLSIRPLLDIRLIQCRRSAHWWFHIRVPGLEVDQLGSLDHGWLRHRHAAVAQGDICTHHPQAQGCPYAERDRRSSLVVPVRPEGLRGRALQDQFEPTLYPGCP